MKGGEGTEVVSRRLGICMTRTTLSKNGQANAVVIEMRRFALSNQSDKCCAGLREVATHTIARVDSRHLNCVLSLLVGYQQSELFERKYCFAQAGTV